MRKSRLHSSLFVYFAYLYLVRTNPYITQTQKKKNQPRMLVKGDCITPVQADQEMCRICLNTDATVPNQEGLQRFCLCKDKSHNSCLSRWIHFKSKHKAAFRCEVCLQAYPTEEIVTEQRLPISKVDPAVIVILVGLTSSILLLLYAITVVDPFSLILDWTMAALILMAVLGIVGFMRFVLWKGFVKRKKRIILMSLEEATTRRTLLGYKIKAK